MTTVSVIIPSYNHELYVEDCIQSVLDQTFQDFEIVITDDGSTDNTVEKIKNFSDSRINLFISNKNKGASIAANHCFANSNGKYIAMLSSDDVWFPKKLDKQVKFLEDNNEICAVFSKVMWIDKFGNTISQKDCPYYDIFNTENRTRFEWLNHFFFQWNVLCHPSSLIRKNILESTGYLNPLFAAIPDLDLWIRLCLKSNIHVLDEKLLKFRYFDDKSNASGETYAGILRNRYEHRKILDHYLAITNIDEFKKTFPQKNFGSKIFETEDIKFLLGQLAVDSGIDFKVLWGLEKIYDYLQDEDNIRRAEKLYGFTPIDFIKLTGQKDIYNINTTINLTPAQMAYEIEAQSEVEGITRKIVIKKLIKQIKYRLILNKYIKLLNNSKYFDEGFYLNHNPDVKESGENPTKHYLLFGGFEGRDPSPFFNSSWYLETYKDVKVNGFNPLVHYLKFGIIEERKIKESNFHQR